MTFLASLPWRKFLVETCAALLLVSCAADETYPGGEYRKMQQSLSGKFEWGVQYYEAGRYQDALKIFERLRKEGTQVREFDLIPYYVGMSHFRLGHFPEASSELEAFLRARTTRAEVQEARLSLLLTYENLGEWKKASSLAAETDKMTLYQSNRALTKLVWARALREQGELLGAKAVLEDALPYLDKLGEDEKLSSSSHSNPDQDLWGRYHFTAILVKEMECNQLGPKELPGKTKKARANRLYAPWLESVTDCLRSTVDTASEELFSRESPWGPRAEQTILHGVLGLAEKVQGFLSKEASVLAKHRSLQKVAREQFYRLLSSVDENLKIFKKRGVNSTALESLRKQIDRLLVAFSSPS